MESVTTLERTPSATGALQNWWSALPRAARVILSILPTLTAGWAVYLWAHTVVGPHHHQFDLAIYFRAINFWAAGNDIYDYSQFDPVNISLGYTYPPLAAVLMSPMAATTFAVVKAITLPAIVLSAAACVLLILRERVVIPRGMTVAVVGIVTAVAFLLEPMRQTLGFGQINLFLMLLVLADVLVLARRGSRFTGVGIGLAMAIKLTPGVFLLYLIVSRQWRAFFVAIGTAVTATLLAAVVAPAETWRFYTSLLFESDRVGFLGSSANQSVNGLLARFTAPLPPSTAVWGLLVLVLLVVGYRRVRTAVAAGDVLAAVTLTGLLGVLISPVSWPHHIVWVLPAVVVLGTTLARGVLTAVRSGGLSRASLRPLIGPAVLVATGVFIWGWDTRIVLGLPDVDYTGLGPLAMVAGSLPMFWTLAALFVLPVTSFPRAALGASSRRVAADARVATTG